MLKSINKGGNIMILEALMEPTKAKQTSPYFYQADIPEFKYDNYEISLLGDYRNIKLTIKAIEQCSREEIIKMFSLINDLLFIALGAFPVLNEYTINGCIQPLDDMINKYKTSKWFNLDYFQLIKIDDALINCRILHKLDNLDKLPLYSFQYITSESYEEVLLFHKLALLLHVVEGMYIAFEGDKGDYENKVKRVFENFLLKEHSFSSNIFGILNVDEDGFLDRIKSTRHSASHFIAKKHSLTTKGDGGAVKMLEYFHCTYIAIRLYLANKLSLEIIDDNIKETLYAIHDWIYKTKCEQNSETVDRCNYKSRHYSVKGLIDTFSNV